jgi:hypothetical protein
VLALLFFLFLRHDMCPALDTALLRRAQHHRRVKR